jgi:hypothetical protein
MSQTSIIAAALVVAFVVFVTVRGELPKYLAVFTGTAPAGGTTGTGGSGGSGGSAPWSQFLPSEPATGPTTEPPGANYPGGVFNPFPNDPSWGWPGFPSGLPGGGAGGPSGPACGMFGCITWPPSMWPD